VKKFLLTSFFIEKKLPYFFVVQENIIIFAQVFLLKTQAARLSYHNFLAALIFIK